MRTVPVPGSVSSTATTASAPFGMGAPVMILIAVPRHNRLGCHAARGDILEHREIDRGTGDISGNDGVAVHRRVGERRQVVTGNHRLGKHQTAGLGKVDTCSW